MKIRIGIATYGLLDKMVNNLQPNMIPKHVELLQMNMLLNEMAAEAARMEKEHSVDAFVASGGNASILSQVISSVPIVTITPTGYDMIAVLQNASLRSDRVGCIFFENSMPDVVNAMLTLKDLLNFSIEVRNYSTKKQLKDILTEFRTMGISDVIGGALVLQMAAEQGLYGHYIVTEMGVISAICSATNLVESRYAEVMQSRQLNSILNFISEGIIATNQEDVITICNPSAERILNIKSASVIGKPVDSVLSNTRLNIVRRTKIEELNQLQVEENTKIITNRVPMLADNVAIGALATFRDISDFEKAEAQIYHNLYAKGFLAKHRFSDIIGNSPLLKKTVARAKQYAASNATILIQGDSGAGKELFAQSIHNESPRKSKPFVAVNCAAMPPQLLESELFGYEDGAFTGAKRGGKKGFFELADTGTIFLDEIAEISFDLQAHLLRVIEQHEVMRVGGERIRPVDVRIIAATNKDLHKMVIEEKFRKDLYYRLNILSLQIPTLAQRPSDIPQTFYYFLCRFCPHIDESILQQLSNYPPLSQYSWPGNVRELRNIAERFSVLSHTDTDYEKILSDALADHAPRSENTAAPAELSHSYILQVLSQCHGNKAEAARLLGVSRSTLWRKLKQIQ